MTCFVGPAVRLPDLGPLSRSTAASLSLCQQQQHTRSQSRHSACVAPVSTGKYGAARGRTDGRASRPLSFPPSKVQVQPF